jgi:SAM-dependent methyltransferase
VEKLRYEEHNNDVFDDGYRSFVSPLVNKVLEDFSSGHEGLDFGAGPGPVVSKILEENNYQIKQYDPFFHDYPELLKAKYDYVACCEVIEHFHIPRKEFELLKSLLRNNAKLYCMTHLYDDSIDFSNWYYKNDNTHVFFYQAETMNWIKSEFGFKSLDLSNRLQVFGA